MKYPWTGLLLITLMSIAFVSTLGYASNAVHAVSTTQLIGDINGDGTVDIFDLIIVAAAFGSSTGDPNWDARGDLNSDGEVDVYDIIMLASHYGESAP